MKRIIRVFSYATADARARFFGDTLLSAVPPGKVLVSGRVWTGTLAPLVDSYLEALAPLSTGFTSGNLLHAQAPGGVLDLGRQWLGDLEQRLLGAVRRPEEAGREPHTDVSAVLAESSQLRRDLGADDPIAVSDGLRRLRRAADRVSRALKDEGERTGGYSEGRKIADATAQRVIAINGRNRQFWDERSVTPQLDSSGRMRWCTGDAAPGARSAGFKDAMAEAARAETPRAHIGALNRAAKSFWNRGEPPTLVADALRKAPAPQGVAEINQRNRAFWAGRS